jgi:hypothetical protein
MSDESSTPARVRWARLRFAIIATLFSEPPEAGATTRRDVDAYAAELAASPLAEATGACGCVACN